MLGKVFWPPIISPCISTDLFALVIAKHPSVVSVGLDVIFALPKYYSERVYGNHVQDTARGPRNLFLHFDSAITINGRNLAPPTLPNVLLTGR